MTSKRRKKTFKTHKHTQTDTNCSRCVSEKDYIEGSCQWKYLFFGQTSLWVEPGDESKWRTYNGSFCHSPHANRVNGQSISTCKTQLNRTVTSSLLLLLRFKWTWANFEPMLFQPKTGWWEWERETIDGKDEIRWFRCSSTFRVTCEIMRHIKLKMPPVHRSHAHIHPDGSKDALSHSPTAHRGVEILFRVPSFNVDRATSMPFSTFHYNLWPLAIVAAWIGRFVSTEKLKNESNGRNAEIRWDKHMQVVVAMDMVLCVREEESERCMDETLRRDTRSTAFRQTGFAQVQQRCVHISFTF